MPKYLDSDGVAYLWKKLENKTKDNLIYYSKTTAEWNADINIISEKNVLYIYTDYKTIQQDGNLILLPGLKVGDGNSFLIDLPFINNGSDSRLEQIVLDHINNDAIHIGSGEREFWNNKLNYQSQLTNETLILNRQ